MAKIKETLPKTAKMPKPAPIQATVKNYSFHRPVRKVQVRHYK